MVSVSSQSPDGMNQIPEGLVRITVSVDVEKANLKTARRALSDAAETVEFVEA